MADQMGWAFLCHFGTSKYVTKIDEHTIVALDGCQTMNKTRQSTKKCRGDGGGMGQDEQHEGDAKGEQIK